jgi:hypothetical protein
MKTSVQIANELFSNLRNGGGTVWLSTEYSTGYVVALPNHELRIDNACLRPNVLQFYVENLLQPGSDGVGFWVDGDKTYIDSVIHVSNRDVALQLGRDYNQLAVYCLDTNEVTEL